MDFKVVIKPIKPKVKETDPIKIEAMKEKKRLQREARKNKPKEPKEEGEKKVKPDYSNEIENINKSLKNIVGLSIDEINAKLKAPPPSTVHYGDNQPIEMVETKKKSKNNKK
jgi:hypothetical protein